MKEEKITQIAIYFSYIFIIVVVLLFAYGFFTGDFFFLGSDGTADDCIPNYMGGCDL